MQIALQNSARKTLFLGSCWLLLAGYSSLCMKIFLAAHFSEQPDLASLQRAATLEPGNADYQYTLGRYYLLARQEPGTALPFFQSAVALNPHKALYWFDLSTTYQVLGDHNEQNHALENALLADPRTPDIAWQAANLYWVEGRPDKALHEFRVVAENDPSLTAAALERCWRIRPDVGALLTYAVPHRADVYSTFLTFLISINEAPAASRVWSEMAQLQQPIESRRVFEYVRYLVDRRDVDLARLVWTQAANLAGLSAYEPSPENLAVNGDFSLAMLNGGFDWLYESVPGVSLALDPTESHSGQRSLAITFDSGGLEDAGIRQWVPVEPNTGYSISVYFKSEGIEGAGGPRFVVQDRFSGDTLFSSDELKGAEFWKEVAGNFTTGPDAKLLVLRVQRVPAGQAIRGRLWIDGVRLVQQSPTEGGA
jgi:tetratricopeptide (TPR) repeat protein